MLKEKIGKENARLAAELAAARAALQHILSFPRDFTSPELFWHGARDAAKAAISSPSAASDVEEVLEAAKDLTERLAAGKSLMEAEDRLLSAVRKWKGA